MTVTSSGTAVVTLPTETEILITREFDAPKHLVYKAWTTPQLVKRWWSGQQGEMTTAEMDVRVGGRWRYVMMEPNGTEIVFSGEYREIVPNERIVNTEVFEAGPGAPPPGSSEDDQATLNVVTFSEADGRTTLTLLTQCPSREIRDAIIDSGMEVGMQQQMDLLEQVATSLR